MSITTSTPARIGGHVVAESLAALGAGAAFGVPGVHALAIWDGLRQTGLPVYGARTELGAGFAADGYARSTGQAAPLILSTGPGALNSLTALMEAASSHVPVVAVCSQIPSDLIGRGWGHLHELADQIASFAPIVKHAARAHSVESIPGIISRAWRIALTPPSGPVFVEVPVDLLRAPAEIDQVTSLEAVVERECAPLDQVEVAATMLAHAGRPVLWAGGGVLRSRAREELQALAQLLDAPVVTTYMGKGAISEDHPLAVGSGCDEAAVMELLSGADVLLCVGTELGEQTTSGYTLDLRGRIIHLDAAPERVGTSYPSVPLVGDAKLTLMALCSELAGHPDGNGDGARRAAAVRERVAAGLQAQGRDAELEILRAVQRALPADAIACWDMTILGYWAAAHLRVTGGQQFHYPLGSGTLGYAWPAAIGATVGHRERPVLAVVGDGGIQYALGELGTAAQHRVAAKLLIVDDGGYGILREYQTADYDRTTAVELPGKDLRAIAAGFGLPARDTTSGDLDGDLQWLLAQPGPAVLVLKARLRSALPTP
ncbi:MAG: thiamine pyrophosphate-binding protein [Solirubrobacteraceae bacterium]